MNPFTSDLCSVEETGGSSNTSITTNNVCTVKLPSFWTTNPNLWFKQVEAYFNLTNISRSQTKYFNVLHVLSEEVTNSVADIIVNIPDTEPYETLKRALIDRHSPSQESKIRQLLTSTEIGDRKPGEFFRYLQSLATPCITDNDIVKHIWIQKLPQSLRIPMLTNHDQTAQGLIATADKIWEATTGNICNVEPQMSTAPKLDPLQTIIKEFQNLKTEISEFKKDHRNSRQNFRSTNFRIPSPRRNRGLSPVNGMCWYHTNFGSKANRCCSPCTYKRHANHTSL